MVAVVEEVLRVAREVHKLTAREVDKAAADGLRSALDDLEENPEITAQLFAVSQAGKSTLFSLLTNGEQYVPVGVGRATTAVVIELISVSSAAQERAEAEWLAPDEALSLALEPIRPFLSVDGPESKPFGGVFRSARDLLSMGGPKHLRQDDKRQDGGPDHQPVAQLLKALETARTRRAEESGQGDERADEDLRVAEVVLRNYDEFCELYKEGFHSVALDELNNWTRQPQNWATATASDMSFDDVRCFFVRRVRLYARTHPVVEGIRILDAPGFGVSALHNKISRDVQQAADAVIVILGAAGSEITSSQLEEIKQLSIGLKDNVFVVWNPKCGRKGDAKSLLPDDLAKLRSVGVRVVGGDDAVVVNLLLALRAVQSARLGSGAAEACERLSETTVATLAAQGRPDYPDTGLGDHDLASEWVYDNLDTTFRNFDLGGHRRVRALLRDDFLTAAADASGWTHEMPKLFDAIRSGRSNVRIRECAERSMDALIYFLAKHPSPGDRMKREEALDLLRLVIAEFNGRTREALDRVEISDELAQDVLNELIDHVLDSQARSNLQSGVNSTIDSETHFTVVPGRVQARVLDYLHARVGLWRDDAKNVAAGRVLSHASAYKFEVDRVRRWLREEAATTEHLGGLAELPTAPRVRIDLGAFDIQFRFASGKVIAAQLAPGILDNCVTWVSDKFMGIVNWFRNGDDWDEKPRFDRDKAKREVWRSIDELLQRDSIRSLLLVNPDALVNPTVVELLRLGRAALLDGPAAAYGEYQQIKSDRTVLAEDSNGGVFGIARRSIDRGFREACEGWVSSTRAVLHGLEEHLEAGSRTSSLAQSQIDEIKGHVTALTEFLGAEQLGRILRSLETYALDPEA